MRQIITKFAAMMSDRAGLTSTEYSTMGGAMAGGVSDMSQNLSTASNSAFDAVTSAVTAISG